MNSIGSISHAIAFVAFAGLTFMLILSRQKNERSGSLLLASGLSSVWALLATVQATNPPLFWAFGGVIDSFRILGWAFFLNSVLNRSSTTDRQGNGEPSTRIKFSDNVSHITSQRATFSVFALCIIAAHLALWWASEIDGLSAQTAVRLIATLWIFSCIAALLRLERFIRATPHEKRPSIRYLTIGLGSMFIFDFIVFTDAQLFSRINTDLWFARGIAYAFVVPLIALSIARNPHWSVSLHVSRQAVTSSITALAGGAYLLITALAAYFVRFSGVEWASVAEVVVVLGGLVVLAILVFSVKLRSRMRVFVSKHLFNFKYDYRHEWLNFTDTLASHIGNTPQAVLRGLSQLVNSEGGLIWRATKSGQIEVLATRGKLDYSTISEADAKAMQDFMLSKLWLIDLDEVREHPGRYENMSLSKEFLANGEAWLVLPLMFKEELVACLLLERSPIQCEINWEDRDLLKTAGRQAATLLKHEQTQMKLAEANQFRAFSKLSAYIVHDLKNIIGQQSLLVSNAARHKHNPEFVEDMITTVDNSVKRMQTLLEQLRTNQTAELSVRVDVVDTLKRVAADRGDRPPTPSLTTSHAQLLVNADPGRLQRVFGHLLQNAQEATPANGTVSIDVVGDGTHSYVSISDTGSGMTPEFIRNRLFKAFESTKGLTGMGIGVFESREYVNSLGGEISVNSEPGFGTVFRIRLPLAVVET